MNKLESVKQLLETNPNVRTNRVYDENHLEEEDYVRLGVRNIGEHKIEGGGKLIFVKGYYQFYSHAVDFWVVPRRGLYTLGELQNFMTSLILDGLEPNHKSDFQSVGDLFNFGNFSFVEKIGEGRVNTKRIIRITDESFSDLRGFVHGERTETTRYAEEYLRKIVVNLLPSWKFAEDLFNNEVSDDMRSLKSLERYRSLEFRI